MVYLKKIGLSLLYIFITILVLTLLLTIFSYFNLIGDKAVSIIKIIIPIISLIIGGLYIGKRSNKRGFIEGLKLGVIFSIIVIVFNYLAFDYSFKFKYILFYLILTACSILGSMIGINMKKETI